MKKYLNIIIFLLSFLYDIDIYIASMNTKNIYLNSNEITLKVRGKGIQNIIYSGFSGGFPSEIICNKVINSYQCDLINDENIIILRWNSKLTTCNEMFRSCSNIIGVDLTKFDTSAVRDMRWMFNECQSLEYANLENMDTSLVTQMNSMFYSCKLLTSINLSNLNSNNCLTRINSMFRFCESLTIVNLTNFDTSKVQRMDELFDSCTSLISIDLSSFIISSISTMQNMFNLCNNLVYINLKNAIKTGSFTITNIFSGVPINVVFCIEEGNSPILYNEIKKKACASYYCLDNNWKSVQQKIINGQFKCVNKCSNYTSILYELNDECYSICPRGYVGNNNKCKCQLEKCLICSEESRGSNLCISCNNEEGYYQKFEDNEKYIDCFKSIDGYYLDENYFKLCYLTCELCNDYGNNDFHHCQKCKSNYSYEMIFEGFKNCYDECPNYYYIDVQNNKTICLPNFDCPEGYSKKIPEKKKCISDCKNDEIYKYERNGICYNDTLEIKITDKINIPNTNKKEKIESNFVTELLEKDFYKSIDINNLQNVLDKINIKDIESNETLQDELINNILSKLSNDNDLSNIGKGDDLIINIKDFKLLFLTTSNQRDNNSIDINFFECEKKLKDYYKLPKNRSLYILQFEIPITGYAIPKIEYLVFYPFYNNSLKQLNLSVCENTKINLSFPIFIKKEDIDKHNRSSRYYNDVCYRTTSEKGTDISLKDRRDEFIHNNMTVCEENCDFIDYNSETKKAICSCFVKINFPVLSKIKFDEKELYSNFIKINNIANINVLKCYRLLFDIKNLIKNIPTYIITIIFVFSIISIFIFYCHDFSLIKSIINKIYKQRKIINNNENAFNKTENNSRNTKKNNQENKKKIKNDFSQTIS